MANPKSSASIQSFVRTAQGLLLLQILVAIIAIAAGTWAVMTVPAAREAVKLRDAALDDLGQAQQDAEDAVQIAETARTNLATSVDMINTTGSAAALLLNGTNPDIPYDMLESAFQSIPVDPLPEEQETWQQAREVIRSKQIEIRVLQGRLDDAITLQEAVRAETEASSEAWARQTVALAALNCQNNELMAAQDLITPAFSVAYPQFLTDPVLVDKCPALDIPPPVAIPAAYEVVDPGTETETDQTPSPAPAPRRAQRTPAVPNYSGPFEIKRAYLHIRQEPQRATAIVLAQALCANGYSVPGIELVAEPNGYPTSGQLRHYYAEQLAQAEAISRVLDRASTATGPYRMVLFSREGLPKDRIEVWLSPDAPTSTSSGSKSFSCQAQTQVSASEVTGSVARLNDPDSTVRVAAGQQVADLMRGSDPGPVSRALIDQLSGDRLNQLSASGRFNMLYMLNLNPRWQGDPLADELSAALDTIEARARGETGVRIGSQTRDCMSKLQEKLIGAEAANTCGGR